MSRRRFSLLALVSAAVGFAFLIPGETAARAADPPKTRAVTARDLKLTVPESWKEQGTKIPFRVATFTVPKVKGDVEDADFVISYLGDSDGGGTDANIERWVNQFEAKDRKSTVTQGKSSEGDYFLVDVQGTWNKPVGMQFRPRTDEVRNARVLGAILKVKGVGTYYIRLMGHEKTVTANAQAFRAAFGADEKSEKPYKSSAQ
jgi:hypothetical protein